MKLNKKRVAQVETKGSEGGYEIDYDNRASQMYIVPRGYSAEDQQQILKSLGEFGINDHQIDQVFSGSE